MAMLVVVTANTEAPGVLTFGIEGEEPAFTVDSAGNITATGEIDGGDP